MCASSDHTTSNKKIKEENKKQSQKRRSITFNRRTKVYLIESLEEYTDKEIEKVWITSSEEKASQKDFIKNIAAQRQGHKEDEEKSICFLGIEHFMSQATLDERKMRKIRTIDAVLNQQDQLWQHDPDYDSEWKEIAKASSSASRGAASIAAFAASKLAAVCALEHARDRHSRRCCS